MPDLSALGPAPRPVPPALLARVWLNPLLFAGVLALGVGSLGVVPALRSGELPAEWHLFWERREAPGWLDAVQRHEHRDRKHGTQVSHTYRYTFRLPDGTTRAGQSGGGSTPLYHMPSKGRGKAERLPVTVEYHPRHVEANRLKGTRAVGGESAVFFGLIVPAAAAALMAVGVWAGWRESHLLRHGQPAVGAVSACRLPAKKGQAEVGGVSASWASQAGYQPLEAFRRSVHDQHQAALRVVPGPAAVGCAAAFAFVFFSFFCGILSAVVAAGLVVGLLPQLGVRTGGWELGAILTGGAVGGLVGGVTAVRLTLRKRTPAAATDATPPAFASVECLVAFPGGELRRTLELHGDERDAAARPLLYDPSRPTRAVLAEELSGAPDLDDEGRWRCRAGWPVVRLGLALAALPLPALAWWLG